jgi:hypothetical protein
MTRLNVLGHRLEGLPIEGNQIDFHIRREVVCRACGGPKQFMSLACWECFKGQSGDIEPLKYFDGMVEDWLAHLDRTNQVASGATVCRTCQRWRRCLMKNGQCLECFDPLMADLGVR